MTPQGFKVELYTINSPTGPRPPEKSQQLGWYEEDENENMNNHSVQSLSRVRLFATPRTAAHQASLVHHQLPESTQTHVHRVSDAISSSVIPFSSCPQSFPASGSFQMSQLFASGGQSIGVSASTSVLPMNTQDWSPLEWTGWISLQSKGFSRVFSNTTVQKHQFFGPQLSFTSIHDHWKNHSLD